MPTRHASAIWEGGGLKTGHGSFHTATGLGGQYTFGSRFEEGTGSNPEELLAAAVASCFAMALSVGLERGGTPPTKIEARADCTLDQVGDAFRITAVKLTVTGAVPELDAEAFQQVVAITKDRCPMTSALGPTVDVQIEAQLAP